MSAIIRILFVSIILLFASLHISAQGRQDYYSIANNTFEKGNYQQALEYYTKLLDEAPDTTMDIYPFTPTYRGFGFISFQEINKVVYQISQCYRLLYDYRNAEIWAAKAKALQDKSFSLAQYWYGMSLLANAKYLRAIEELREFNSQITKSSPKYYEALLGIESSMNAIEMMKKPDSIQLLKLPDPVNQSSSAFAPGIYNGEILLYSSSVKMIADPEKPGEEEPKLQSRLFRSVYTTGGWGTPQQISIPVEEGWNIGGASFSKDMRKAFFTLWRGNEANGEFAIYFSRSVNGVWGMPKELGRNVNIPGDRSMMPYFDEERGLLYFVSEKQGGQGGLDIWYCMTDTMGNVGVSTNLGPDINTPYDEITPYYNSKQKVLFFSTNGRKGMGGFDVHYAKGELGKWEAVQNMGYPINSSRQEAWYSSTDDYRVAYFASDRQDCEKNCGIACYKVYQINTPPFTVGGYVLDRETQVPVPGTIVYLIDPVNGKIINETTVDEKGYYRFEVEPGSRYKIRGSKKGFVSGNNTVAIENKIKPEQVEAGGIFLSKIVIDKPIVVKDIYYDYNKATLRPESKYALDSLVLFLKAHPNLLIEIGAHTDSKGNDNYNLKLSDARARSVVDYLISQGISSSVLLSKGYGESVPLAPNENLDGSDNPDNRQLNRRTEFKVKKILEVKPPEPQPEAIARPE